MSQAQGSSLQLVLDREATYGVTPSPTTSAIGPMSINRCTVSARRNITVPATLQGNLNAVQGFLGNTDVQGEIVIPVDLRQFGHWLRNMFGAEVGVVGGSKTAAAVTVDNTTETITLSTHGLSNGQAIVFGGTALPGGITASKLYFLRDKDTNTFKVAASPGGAVVAISSNGTDVTITTVNAHVFKAGTAMPSLVLEKAFTDISQYFRYNGVKIGSFGMQLGGDGELVANLGLLGADENPIVARYQASPVTPGALLRVNNFQASLLEGGSAFATARSASLNIDFDLDGDQYIIGGAGKRGSLPQGVTKISGALSTLFEDATLYTKAINNTETSLELRLAYSASAYLYILMPEVTYGFKSPGVEGPRGVLFDVDYTAAYGDADEATSLQWILVNDRATAY